MADSSSVDRADVDAPAPAPPFPPRLFPVPTQQCTTCGRVVEVKYFARGFPPDVAKRVLVRLCKADGHEATTAYRAGVAPSLLGDSAGAPTPSLADRGQPVPSSLEETT